jgi:transcriptional regulator with XRE-family HTH domain
MAVFVSNTYYESNSVDKSKESLLTGSTMQTLAMRIRESRKFGELSRAELARRVGVRPSAAVQWELEDGTAPSVRNLMKIAGVLNVSFEWLATGRGMARPKSLHEVPAVTTDDFAHNLYEEQMLALAREMPTKWREPLVEFLRTILGKKS